MLRKFRGQWNIVLLLFLCLGVIFLVSKSNRRAKLEPGGYNENPRQRSPVDAEAENNRRTARVRQICEKYKLGIFRGTEKNALYKYPPAPQYSVFYIDRIHRVSYCPIYKAASTTWLHNLCLLNGVPEAELTSGREQISTISRRVIPELEYPEAEEAMRGTKKLLVVRHPFERLLSAYRDKLENSMAGREHGTLHFYNKYGSRIVRKYRGKNFTPPRDDQVIRKPGVPGPAGIEPTFREFVDYLIDTDLASYGDDHWMPYYLFCTPCSFKYDIVAKVETLNEDQLFAIGKLGLTGKIEPRWRHTLGGHSNASRIYFGQLSSDRIERLFAKFALDFEMFDYSPSDYHGYAAAAAAAAESNE